jgi:predicted AlkP superfamily phosphohydrolase/phosphomutase
MNPPKVLLFGLDAAEPNFLRHWSQAGVMPFLREFYEDGATGVLRSTIPPYTPTAWTSITTGVNPGRHGVFGFTRLTSNMQEAFVDANVCGCKTIWEYLTDQGRPSLVLNVPITYPPRDLNGVLVSGMGTPPGIQKFVSPASYQERIDSLVPGYVPDVSIDGSVAVSERRSWAAVDQIEAALGQRLSLAEHLLASEPWEFAMLVLEAPDRLQHLFWRRLSPSAPPSPERDRLLRIYQQMDEGMRRLANVARHEGPVVVIVVSDHGFQDWNWTLFANNLLRKHGLLALRRGLSLSSVARSLPSPLRRIAARMVSGTISRKHGPDSGQIDWARTRAFSGKVFEQGIYVRGDESPSAFRDETRSCLETLPCPDGSSGAISELLEREDVYDGPRTTEAPTFFPRFTFPGVMMSGSLSHGELWESQSKSEGGTHHEDGVILAMGPEVQRADSLIADAQDVAPSVLQLLGAPVPRALDGAQISPITRGVVDERDMPIERTEDLISTYTEEQEREITDHLRGLGYFE